MGFGLGYMPGDRRALGFWPGRGPGPPGYETPQIRLAAARSRGLQMSSGDFLDLCLHSGFWARATGWFLYSPLFVSAGVTFAHMVYLDATSMCVNLSSFFFSWLVLQGVSLTLLSDRPNVGRCATLDGGLFGLYGMPDALGGTLFVYVAIWALVWLTSRVRYIGKLLVLLVLLTAGYFAGALLNDYLSAAQVVVTVALSSLLALLFFFVFRQLLLPALGGVNERSLERLGIHNLLLGEVKEHM